MRRLSILNSNHLIVLVATNLVKDTIDHIFITGDFARYIWNYFVGSLGMGMNYRSLRNVVMRWWSANSKNDLYKLVLQSTPIFVCWNLWKNRCACKYGEKSSNVSRVKYDMFKDTFHLLYAAYPYIKWPSN